MKPAIDSAGQDKKRQWLWFLALWCGGLLSVAALSYALKLFLKLV